MRRQHKTIQFENTDRFRFRDVAKTFLFKKKNYRHAHQTRVRWSLWGPESTRHGPNLQRWRIFIFRQTSLNHLLTMNRTPDVEAFAEDIIEQIRGIVIEDRRVSVREITATEVLSELSKCGKMGFTCFFTRLFKHLLWIRDIKEIPNICEKYLNCCKFDQNYFTSCNTLIL